MTPHEEEVVTEPQLRGPGGGGGGTSGDASGHGMGNGNAYSLNDQVILDDLIVDGSLFVGFDCFNGESFGFDTIRLKENNTRI